MTTTAFAPPRPATSTSRPRILCVDDEPNVLDGLRDSLRRSFDVRTAESGHDGLRLLREAPDDYAIVISDMRMPLMNGADFLREARTVAPHAIRMLLTGQTDLDSAVRAVNEGHLFRFLAKPCSREELLRACAGALTQRNLILTEKVLLEQTLRGSIRALAEVLALAAPVGFGRAERAQRQAKRLAEAADVANVWELEIAALLSQIGVVTLPDETVERIYVGVSLSPAERQAAAQLPDVAVKLLAEIPRLERVRAMIAAHQRPFETVAELPAEEAERALPAGARILKIVFDHDALASTGMEPELTLATMRGRDGWYDPRLLELFLELQGAGEQRREVRELRVGALEPGMTLLQDVRTHDDMLLVAHGNQVTAALLARLAHVGAQRVVEPIRVALPLPEEV